MQTINMYANILYFYANIQSYFHFSLFIAFSHHEAIRINIYFDEESIYLYLNLNIILDVGGIKFENCTQIVHNLRVMNHDFIG